MEPATENPSLSGENTLTPDEHSAQPHLSPPVGNLSGAETPPRVEMTDDVFKALVNKSCGYITEYVRSRPDILYKGVPLLVAVYILSPVMFFAWEWMPWIWASYEIYRRVPLGIIATGWEATKTYTRKS